MSESHPEDREVNVSATRFGPRLCDYCNRLFSKMESKCAWGYRFVEPKCDWHLTLYSLHNAVRFGCQFCLMFQCGIRRQGFFDAEGPSSKNSPNSCINMENAHLERLYMSYYGGSEGVHIDLFFSSNILRILISGAPDSHLPYPGTSRETSSIELNSLQAALLTSYLFCYLDRPKECTHGIRIY